jgi:hypothetical protein
VTAKVIYFIVCLGGLGLALIDPKLAFGYSIIGILLLISVQASVIRNDANNGFVKTLHEFKNLDSKLKIRAFTLQLRDNYEGTSSSRLTCQFQDLSSMQRKFHR